ncbi:DNA polymerase III subunit alpha, partial [Trebonia sp.]|uniref:DNA polymerase III subunit alpha n=1 Tax=Trebonia sp. TaxID=2767075 RepID=UPI00262985D5
MTDPAQFAHLHVASSFSLRYGTATPGALVARAAELGMPALALTDRDGLYGAFKHTQACVNAGVKPVLGADLAVPGAGPGTGRVTLLATGRQGWASLCRLVSAAHATVRRESRESRQSRESRRQSRRESPGSPEGQQGRESQQIRQQNSRETRGDTQDTPAVTPQLIAEHADGLVILLGPASDVGQAIAARRPDQARKALDRWRHLSDTVVEVVDHLEHKSTVRAARMAELAQNAKVPAVLTNAVRYLDPADSRAAQVLDAARHLVPLGSPALVPHNGRAYLASQEDMAAAAERVAAAMGARRKRTTARGLLQATAELADKCALDPARDLGIGTHHLPETKIRPGAEQRELTERCEHALAHGRYRTAHPANRPQGTSQRSAARNARDRLEHELNIIAHTGMASYFLTVADVADRIRNNGIRCAIRGSGAGSFVNHLLGISAIDPLEHDLLMERFLSPVRTTLPDIDLDVESARRLEAYQTIFDAYGNERTACVCMMETYRARSAIRDVAAAMSLPPDEINTIAKAFPHIRARHISTALTELPELRNSRLDAPQLATVFQIAQQLDGLPRHVAMHPCGVLLSNDTLLDRTATQQSTEGFPLSQLDKDDAEIAGVIKLDVLGVRMQSAMAHTLAEIKRTEHEDIDLDAIPRGDESTYAMIGSSRTIGCFQIESPGQRELVKKLAPRDVQDLIVDISLFRPGPVNSDMISPFLRVRHHLAEPRFPHERLREALEETGGVVVFHEQVLRVIDTMTGCGLPEADLVRRHLSADNGPQRTEPWFRARALARGFDPVTVDRVWEVVAAFGGFGFCKAHAAAFAIPVYQSAWLKRHHPAAFYAGVLTHDPGMYPKRVIVQDARLAGIPVLPVDVNASAAQWEVQDPSSRTIPPASPAIRVSLREVKGISDSEVERIVAGQPYTSLRDFWERARVSRPVVERLVLIGAFDSLYEAPAPGAPVPADSACAASAAHAPLPADSACAASAAHAPVPADSACAASAAHAPASACAASAVHAPAFAGPAPAAPAPMSPSDSHITSPPPATPSPASAAPPSSPSRRDLLARVGVLDRAGARATAPALDLFADAEAADGMADLVPAGQLRDLDLAERVAAELDILGFDVSGHVLDFYAGLLDGLGVVRSDRLDGCRNGETVCVAGVKVATQTPAVRSGQRIIFASLDDAVGLVDLA